jgi:2-polyprenyl-6-hydroxyphenyl methylase/3-demethylubiquinone-9 3-methyltransferase
MKLQGGPSLTDRNLSFAAAEYVWDSPESAGSHQSIVPLAIRILRQHNAESVLDLGCGNGALTAELQRAGFQMSGCDMSESGIALARAHYPQIPFFQQDLSDPLPKAHAGQYDAVISIEVIEHLLLPRFLIESAVRALRMGGVFVLSTPFHGYWKNLALALTNKFDSHWHPMRDFGHVKFFSKKTLSALLRERELQVRRIHTVGRVPPLARNMVLEAVKPGGLLSQ